MKKLFLIFTLLFVSVMTSACINNLAVQELNNKAVKYMDNGDTETAICRLKSSLDLDDEIYQTHYNLAVAYNSLERQKDAIEELKRVHELKPDFYDAIYTIAVAKEGLASKIINKDSDIDSENYEPTIRDMAEYNIIAGEAVELYNEYLVKKVNAEETDQINARIEELNEKIKEFTYKLESSPQDTQEASQTDEQM